MKLLILKNRDWKKPGAVDAILNAVQKKSLTEASKQVISQCQKLSKSQKKELKKSYFWQYKILPYKGAPSVVAAIKHLEYAQCLC